MPTRADSQLTKEANGLSGTVLMVPMPKKGHQPGAERRRGGPDEQIAALLAVCREGADVVAAFLRLTLHRSDETVGRTTGVARENGYIHAYIRPRVHESLLNVFFFFYFYITLIDPSHMLRGL